MYASYNKSSTLVLGLFLRMAGGGGGPAEDFRTSEQREFARIEQERLDAELARQLAASEGAGQPGHPPAARDGPRSHDAGLLFAPPHHTPDPPWGRDYYEAVPEGYQQLPAGRQPSVVQLPLVQHFFCCISLRCGVLIVAACDAVSAIFQVGFPAVARPCLRPRSHPRGHVPPRCAPVNPDGRSPRSPLWRSVIRCCRRPLGRCWC
jgi:hypothetical protein